MNTGELPYSAHLPIPHAIEPSIFNELRCPMYKDGTLIAPTESAVVILDGSGAAVLPATDAPIIDSVATLSWLAPADLPLAAHYRVEWVHTIEGKIVRVRSAAEVVRRRLFCPVVQLDLFRRVSDLDPASDHPLTCKMSFADAIAEAWVWVIHQIRQHGRRVDLIIDASALRETTIAKALEFIHDNMGRHYTDAAKRYRTQAREELADVQLVYAEDDAEVVTTPAEPVPSGFWMV